MEIFVQGLILALGFILLIKGADWFVDGASGIAMKLRIPQLVIGLTIVAMGTSAPEAAVSITAALKGNADITIGNIVGSNIMNILIILGLSALIIPLVVQKSTLWIEIPFMIVVTAVLLLQGLDGTISLADGVVLWVIFLVYLGYLFCLARRNRKKEQAQEQQQEQQEQTLQSHPVSIPKALTGTVIGLICIIIGSNLTVDSAGNLARIFGMSERLIGLTIVALGTSLPELFTSVNAARKHNSDIAIGNIVGSNLFNILFVVGTSALITPVPFAAAFMIDMIVAGAAAILLFICCIRTHSLRRPAGILMLILYTGYLVFLCMK